MLNRRIEKLERLLDKLPFDPQRWYALHANDTREEKQAALRALSDAELEILCADNPPWLRALTDEQLERLCEAQDDGDLSAFWASLTPEQQRMIGEARDLNW